VRLKLELARARFFELRLRSPAWCNGATVSIKGRRGAPPTPDRGYFVLSREWRNGDTVELDLPMPVQRVAAHPNVRANAGLLALQRGPLVYCLEACDHSEPLDSLFLPAASELRVTKANSLLGGVVTLKGEGHLAPELDWTRRLYQASPPTRRVPITAIPYYAWDNRQAGAMKVWLPVVPAPQVAGGLETRAKVSLSFVSNNCQPEAIHDGVEPKRSGDQPAANCHWWPHKGTDEWAQYTWNKPVTVGSAKVYWFDDTGRGECRLPASWRLEFLNGADWQPVKAHGSYAVKPDQWCEVAFDPVRTTALRLRLKLETDWAAGVHEWKVLEGDEP
jgi:hypothetical protein